MDIIEVGPHLPLTTSTLARQCHVSVRTLQQGFHRHLGMSPMAYVRVVRTPPCPPGSALGGSRPLHRRRHRAPLGFTNLSRFAAAHKTMYGQAPLQVLRAAQ